MLSCRGDCSLVLVLLSMFIFLVVFRCPVLFLVLNQNCFVFRVELNLELCVFICISILSEKLISPKVSVTALLYSHYEIKFNNDNT